LQLGSPPKQGEVVFRECKHIKNIFEDVYNFKEKNKKNKGTTKNRKFR
jgi:hypothetical protein